MPVIIIAAAVAAAGGMMAAESKRKGAQEAGDAKKAALNQYLAKLDAIGMPPDQSKALILEQYKQQGILTPQLEQYLTNSVSEYKNIKEDPGLRDTQMSALKQMSRYGKAGLTPEERAEMQQSRQGVQRDLEAKNQQIAQEFQARGMGGAGQEMAQRLLASQAGADRASEEGDRISALASQRALQAISQSSSMAGQLRGQDFSQDAARAEAMDQMNRFNVGNQMAIGQRNAQASNIAQAGNLTNKQDLSNMNVGGANEEKYQRLQRERNFWNDKLRYAQAYQQPLGDYGNANAQQSLAESDSRAKMISAGSQGLSSMIGAFGGGMGGGGGGGGGIDYSSWMNKLKTDNKGGGAASGQA